MSVYDPDSGELVCEHPRAYGSAPTDTSDPASQLALLAWNAGGWENSRVREALPDELREHMDSLDRAGLKAELRVMRDQAATSGWEATLQAVRLAYEATGRIDEASVAVSAARAAAGPSPTTSPWASASTTASWGWRRWPGPHAPTGACSSPR